MLCQPTGDAINLWLDLGVETEFFQNERIICLCFAGSCNQRIVGCRFSRYIPGQFILSLPPLKITLEAGKYIAGGRISKNTV